MAAIMKYQNRIVLYIDLLGFKELLNETTDKEGGDYKSGNQQTTRLKAVV